MRKIPVGRSIGGAYGFLFGHFLTILGLSWLPAAIYAAGRLTFLRYAGPDMVAAMHGEHLPVQSHLMHFGFFLFTALLISVIALSLSREALGLRHHRVAAHFVIGARELRLFLAILLITVLMVLLIAALVFAVIGIGIGTKMALATWAQGTILAQWPVAHVMKVVDIAAAIGVVLYVGLRLKFFIAPIAAAEDKASIMRAWSLSRGNALRILAIQLAALLPAVLVLACIEYSVLGPQLHDIGAMAFAPGKHPDATALYRLIADHAPMLVSIATAGLVILVALSVGASAAAYRALVTPPASQAPAEPRPEPQARIEPSMHDEPHAFAEPEIVSAPEIHAAEPAQEVAEEAAAPEAHAIEEIAAPAEEPAPPAEEAAAEILHEPAPEAHAAAAEPEGVAHHGVYTADEIIEAAPEEAPLEMAPAEIIEEQPAEAHEPVLAEEAHAHEEPHAHDAASEPGIEAH